MAIIEAMDMGKPRVDLSGPNGNVFALLAMAKGLCKRLEIDFDQVHEEMTSGTYNRALYVFNRYFGDYVDLVLPHGITEQHLIMDVLSN